MLNRFPGLCIEKKSKRTPPILEAPFPEIGMTGSRRIVRSNDERISYSLLRKRKNPQLNAAERKWCFRASGSICNAQKLIQSKSNSRNSLSKLLATQERSTSQQSSDQAKLAFIPQQEMEGLLDDCRQELVWSILIGKSSNSKRTRGNPWMLPKLRPTGA